MTTRASSKKNFWLWGTWGKRLIKLPFLTQKVEEPIRNIIIGPNFIIALQGDGKLVSWGEDKQGCLGQGPDNPIQPDPKPIRIQDVGEAKVIDVQFGKKHVLALTSEGKVYAWGNNDSGQLGAGDTQPRWQPTPVEVGTDEAVSQIVAVESQSYCLTENGTVYAWGDNKDGILALEHVNPRVQKPEPMLKIKQDGPVKKLELKDTGSAGGKAGKVIIAYVELAEELKDEEKIGGFASNLGQEAKDIVAQEPGKGKAGGGDFQVDHGTETAIFEGINMMRRVMDNTQEWYLHMLDVRHGAPYDDVPTQVDTVTEYAKHTREGDNCTAYELDCFVNVDTLEKASYELDLLIQGTRAQLEEIREMKGTKNVKFMLAMFMDDAKLRREKIRRTVDARRLVDLKRGVSQAAAYMVSDLGNKTDVKKLSQANEQLQRTMEKVKGAKAHDVFTRCLQDSILECIANKIQLHDTQIELLKAKSGDKVDPVAPALRAIKDGWNALKHYSIYFLYQECKIRQENLRFGTEEELLTYLTKNSNDRIDQIINIDKDQMISRDSMVPSLCYELLVENAELRKMCNTYQLRVLIMRDRDKKGVRGGAGPGP